jgi:preprotein translocase subunit SecD
MPFYVVSILLIIASWALVFTNGLNYGVDFAGGQEVRLTFEGREEAPIPELREELEQLGYGTPQIQRFGEDNQISIRIQLPEEAEDQPGAATAIGNEVIQTIQGAREIMPSGERSGVCLSSSNSNEPTFGYRPKSCHATPIQASIAATPRRRTCPSGIAPGLHRVRGGRKVPRSSL